MLAGDSVNVAPTLLRHGRSCWVLAGRDDDHRSRPGVAVSLGVVPRLQDAIHLGRDDALGVHREANRQHALRAHHRQRRRVAKLLDEDGRAAIAQHADRVVEAVGVAVRQDEVPVVVGDAAVAEEVVLEEGPDLDRAHAAAVLKRAAEVELHLGILARIVRRIDGVGQRRPQRRVDRPDRTLEVGEREGHRRDRERQPAKSQEASVALRALSARKAYARVGQASAKVDHAGQAEVPESEGGRALERVSKRPLRWLCSYEERTA